MDKVKNYVKDIENLNFEFTEDMGQLEPILKHAELFPHIRDKIQDISVQMRRS